MTAMHSVCEADYESARAIFGGRDVPGLPFTVTVELLYQPIGYRWVHNLERYDAPEPKRFLNYFNVMSASSSVVVAKTSATQQ